MHLTTLHLADFRLFDAATFRPDPVGTTVLTGPNGTGKTSILEAVAYLGTQRSFRGAPKEALVRTGAERAVIRADLEREGRPMLVEAEISLVGRSRAQVNRQPARTRRELADAVAVSVFSPDDLAVVQGAPVRRRDLLDDALRLIDVPAAGALEEADRVLRQRAALLRQAHGRLTPEIATTLDVWDERLARAGNTVAAARGALVDALGPPAAQAFARLAASQEGGPARCSVIYRPSWDGDLGKTLAANRDLDVRRAVTSAGPHRDDVAFTLAGRDARTQASQGEQRCLALAVRLAIHAKVAEARGNPPLLLLDDVFSELDPARAAALVAALPAGQTLLTTAGPLPEGVTIASRVVVGDLRSEAP